MAGEVLVDALPYIDSGYDEAGVKQAALALVEEECKRYKSTKNYLDFLGPINVHSFETELMNSEFERMEQHVAMDMLSMKRYELPPPPQNKQTDANTWFECVQNSCAQLEHQASRILNLEIMSEYGSGAWRVYNQTLKIMFDQAEKQLEVLKKQIQETNLSRKTEQSYAGLKLKSLEDNWVGLVSKNYEIECAIAELEKELVELKKKKASKEDVNVMNIGRDEAAAAEDGTLPDRADTPDETMPETNEDKCETIESMDTSLTKSINTTDTPSSIDDENKENQ